MWSRLEIHMTHSQSEPKRKENTNTYVCGGIYTNTHTYTQIAVYSIYRRLYKERVLVYYFQYFTHNTVCRIESVLCWGVGGTGFGSIRQVEHVFIW